MKKEILKIAGVKSEAEFYKKFPTEKSFMAKHSKALKKAQVGSYIGGEKTSPVKPIRFADYYNDFGAADALMKKQPADTQPKQEKGGAGGIGNILGSLTGGAGGGGGDMQSIGEIAKVAGMFLKRGGKVKQKYDAGGAAATSAALQNADGDFLSKIAGYAGPAGKVIAAGQQINDAIQRNKQARQTDLLSRVSLEASGTREEETKRRYVRDQVVDPGQLGSPYGQGTNFLAENGMSIGGNPTEIQNTYAPGTIYDDLGFEPLNDSNKIKRYKKGGQMKQALAGAALAQAIGQAAEMAGTLTSGIIDIGTKKRVKQAQQNAGQAALQTGAQDLQSQYASFLKDGGWVSHDWQPQTITKFGDYSLKELLAPPKDADMLRAGGEVRKMRSNYMGDDERLSMMQMGGELQTHWGGDAEVISENPYLPNNGETIMFKGNSHEESDGQGRTGIGVTFGEGEVEVEGGEPAIKLKDGGTGEDNLVVYGNMYVPKYIASELEDDSANGMKFKSYANKLSKMETKQNKLIDKNLEMLENTDGDDEFSRLKIASIQSNMMGANMKLKDYAKKKQVLAYGQDAILSTAEERGLEPDALAKGKIKRAKNSGMAKFGKNLKKAQDGTEFPENYTDVWGSATPTKLNLIEEPQTFGTVGEAAPFEVFPIVPDKKEDKKKSLFDRVSELYNQALPQIRPSNQRELSGEQILPELTALGLNAPTAVQAQYYTPLLPGAPAEISLQDQLNAIQSDFNALQRQVGYNPAALSQLAAQKYKATSQVLGEQARTNIAAKQEYYNLIRNTLNDATLKNLGIEDQKYVRGEEAKSKTKAQSLEALSSIASKIAQNKLENRTLGTYENLYDYRFGPKGRAINLNQLAQFNTEGNPFARTQTPAKGTLAPGKAYTYDENNNIVGVRSLTKEEQGGRNGKIVKSFKNL